MQFVLGLIVGLGIGIVIMLFRSEPSELGTLRIVTPASDPDETPYMFMELNKGIGNISQYEQGLFRISVEKYGTRK